MDLSGPYFGPLYAPDRGGSRFCESVRFGGIPW